MEYIPLPILSKTYRVVKYNNKYAVVLTKEAEDDLESVIVTEALPDDLNIDALIVDVFSQLRGEKPAKMPTKAMVILHDAEKLLQEKQSRTGAPLTGDSYFVEMAGALEIYGGTEYLKTLPHDDIAPDYWDQLMAASLRLSSCHRLHSQLTLRSHSVSSQPRLQPEIPSRICPRQRAWKPSCPFSDQQKRKTEKSSFPMRAGSVYS